MTAARNQDVTPHDYTGQKVQDWNKRVIVNIYDVGKFTRLFNEVTRTLGGAGIFHAGIEVYGDEWSFGFCDEGTGITWNQPRRHRDHNFRESIHIGYTQLDQIEVEALVSRMQKEWPGNSYKLLSHNCLTFADAFLIELGLPVMPEWVRSLPKNTIAADTAVSNARQDIEEHVADGRQSAGSLGTSIWNMFADFGAGVAGALEDEDSPPKQKNKRRDSEIMPEPLKDHARRQFCQSVRSSNSNSPTVDPMATMVFPRRPDLPQASKVVSKPMPVTNQTVASHYQHNMPHSSDSISSMNNLPANSTAPVPGRYYEYSSVNPQSTGASGQPVDLSIQDCESDEGDTPVVVDLQKLSQDEHVVPVINLNLFERQGV